jgi:hypothetical protein
MDGPRDLFVRSVARELAGGETDFSGLDYAVKLEIGIVWVGSSFWGGNGSSRGLGLRSPVHSAPLRLQNLTQNFLHPRDGTQTPHL